VALPYQSAEARAQAKKGIIAFPAVFPAMATEFM